MSSHAAGQRDNMQQENTQPVSSHHAAEDAADEHPANGMSSIILHLLCPLQFHHQQHPSQAPCHHPAAR